MNNKGTKIVHNSSQFLKILISQQFVKLYYRIDIEHFNNSGFAIYIIDIQHIAHLHYPKTINPLTRANL